MARELRGCLELLARISGELQPAGVRIGQINIAAMQNISIHELTDKQLEDLLKMVCDGAALPRTLRSTRLKDETTVPPPANIETWQRSDENIAALRARRGAPDPGWQPHREASIADRYRMLLALWERLTGQSLAESMRIEDLGARAVIQAEFDLSDDRPEWWFTWPMVRLFADGFAALPQTIEGE